MSRTFKITVAYDGTHFAGWQVQPEQPTIQGMLERAILRITGEAVRVIGSGRTDSGVHAIAQVANFTLAGWEHAAERLRSAINTQLPETILVHELVDAPDGFHAIRDAVRKRYRYQLQIGGAPDVFQHPYHWRLKGEMSLERIQEAVRLFVGEQDFASFQAAGSERQSTVREIFACELCQQSKSEFGAIHVAIEVEANGFLYNMVRNIVGTLAEVGRGKHPPSWVSEVIAAKNRDVAGPTAPAHGLYLLRVDYPAFADS
ncbi:MAG: tRNA pseudouridine(38-40) synthase TruA [Rubripirellula sp.]